MEEWLDDSKKRVYQRDYLDMPAKHQANTGVAPYSSGRVARSSAMILAGTTVEKRAPPTLHNMCERLDALALMPRCGDGS